MPFPTEIQTALQTYDANKGFWRRLFRRDQAAIRALRQLNKIDQTNLVKICLCFIENKPKVTQESYKVFLVLSDYLKNINCDGLPETLNQLHRNKLLNLNNIDQLTELKGNQFSLLALLFPLLTIRSLLTQANFDKIAKFLKISTKNILKELSSIVDAVHLLGNRYLTQENLNWVLEKPLQARNIVSILKILDKNDMLTPDNRIQLYNEKNEFLFSNQAYLEVWYLLEAYLPTIVDIHKKQVILDQLIHLTQEEDSIKKIEDYMRDLIPEPSKSIKRNTYDKFSTAPSTHSKSRSSINTLNLIIDRPGTL